MKYSTCSKSLHDINFVVSVWKKNWYFCAQHNYDERLGESLC